MPPLARCLATTLRHAGRVLNPECTSGGVGKAGSADVAPHLSGVPSSECCVSSYEWRVRDGVSDRHNVKERVRPKAADMLLAISAKGACGRHAAVCEQVSASEQLCALPFALLLDVAAHKNQQLHHTTLKSNIILYGLSGHGLPITADWCKSMQSQSMHQALQAC